MAAAVISALAAVAWRESERRKDVLGRHVKHLTLLVGLVLDLRLVGMSSIESALVVLLLLLLLLLEMVERSARRRGRSAIESAILKVNTLPAVLR